MLVLAAVAQFERSVIRERINAGLAAAREHGTKSGKPFGRSRTLDRHVSAVAKLSRSGLSGRRIAAKLNIPAGDTAQTSAKKLCRIMSPLALPATRQTRFPQVNFERDASSRHPRHPRLCSYLCSYFVHWSMTRNFDFIGKSACGGEGGIRTLGSLLGYGALAKRCFRPLSHLTKSKARISRRIADCQSLIADRSDWR
jgi:hypothetical protein